MKDITVRELIEHLKECDQNAVVCTKDIEYVNDLDLVVTHYAMESCTEMEAHYESNTGNELFNRVVIIN